MHIRSPRSAGCYMCAPRRRWRAARRARVPSSSTWGRALHPRRSCGSETYTAGTQRGVHRAHGTPRGGRHTRKHAVGPAAPDTAAGSWWPVVPMERGEPNVASVVALRGDVLAPITPEGEDVEPLLLHRAGRGGFPAAATRTVAPPWGGGMGDVPGGARRDAPPPAGAERVYYNGRCPPRI